MDNKLVQFVVAFVLVFKSSQLWERFVETMQECSIGQLRMAAKDGGQIDDIGVY